MICQPVTVQHRTHECPRPALALERRSRIEVLKIDLRDDGADPAVADLADDRIRVDDPAFDETRPKEKVIDDRRDPGLGE